MLQCIYSPPWSGPNKTKLDVLSLLSSDIYMLHWPGSMPPGGCNRELRASSWRALEELYDQGKPEQPDDIHSGR